MSKERRIERLLDKYDEKGADLYNEFNIRMDNRTVDKAGEASPEETLDIQIWLAERETAIKNWFVEEIKDIFKKER